MVSFAAGFAAVIVLSLIIWLGERRSRRRFETELSSNQLAALQAHLVLGHSWRHFRKELRRARAREKAEREALRQIADERHVAVPIVVSQTKSLTNVAIDGDPNENKNITAPEPKTS